MNFTEFKTYVDTASGDLYPNDMVLTFLNEALTELGKLHNATYPKASLTDVSAELSLPLEWQYMLASFVTYRLFQADSRFREAETYKTEWEDKKQDFASQYIPPNIYSNSITKTTITVDVIANSNTVTVEDIRGFVAGHKVILTDGTNEEILIVSTINNNDISFSSNLFYDYKAGDTLYHPEPIVNGWDSVTVFDWWRV